ncbi:/ argF / Ornithine carbamoyltransferase /:229965 Forward [Candidatus Hepatoplasma crinochetorum]|uniref:Ornithine carbamoyltransferase n=1 Tax=Candidatus Hepatoplasma crinochetorum TaxID=295596 RepID=A0A0G7ZME2_9MOLU|nr:/ argF / Ornithine carbamoyltransferase /:229965 Forward [Candidatus Hepatoplasma crinochetorum]
MTVNLKNRSILTVADLTTEEVRYLLDLSKTLKDKHKSNKNKSEYKHTNKNIAIIMQKTSTRTRSAFEVAAMNLGIGTTYISGSDSQMGVKESMEDTAKVMGRFYDGIAFRGFKHQDVEILAKNAGVPVWNALTDKWHPTQMFADYLTILEYFKTTKVKFVFFGDAKNNMGNSLVVMSAHMGAHFVGCAPKNYWPSDDIIKKAEEIAKNTGAKIEFTEDPMIASKGADVLYTDIWVSMGEPEEVWKKRIHDLEPYRINKKLIDNAKRTAIFMHCLPSYHDLNTDIAREINKKFKLKEFEVTDEVFRSNQSKVFDEAENRMHTIKAIIHATI